jgi:hypothetical protein
MTIRRARWLATLTLIISAVGSAIALTPTEVSAQQVYVPAVGMPPVVPGQMAWYPAGGGGIAPTAYQEAPPTTAEGAPVDSDAGGYCPECDPHPGLGHLLGWLAPYAGGGCCQPRWFDVEAAAVWLSLERHNTPYIVFSRDTSGVDRITSSDLGPGDRAGLRVTIAHQVGPGSNLEFSYFGLFDYQTQAEANGEGNLNSIFSDFTNLNPPFGLEQFDLANYHSVWLSNDIDSMELNYRRRWQGPNCLFQGSWLVGARYVQVKDNLTWLSVVPSSDPDAPAGERGGEGHYSVTGANYMPGGQVGGDIWVCMLPGFSIGAEIKAALLGNNAQQKTIMSSWDPVNQFQGIIDEGVKHSKVAFVGDVSLMATWRLTPQWTLRGGYHMMFVEGVATALENFNPDVPALTTRTPFLADGGSLFYHGFSVGAEWMW